MDRNKISFGANIAIPVALRKESVDRNSFYAQNRHLAKQSLSARRAWIEIVSRPDRRVHGFVALRKESVDRNREIVKKTHGDSKSLSARRAWIEIPKIR